MCFKPNFLRTIDPKNFSDAHFDVNVMSISSHQPLDYHFSIIVVDGREHHVYTSELKELVNLPDSLG